MKIRHAAVVLGCLVLVQGSALAGQAERITLQRVSGPSPFAGQACGFSPENDEWEWETSVAVDPNDPDRIAVAWLQGEGRGIVVASSRDAGQTWTHALPPGLSSCTGGDMALALHPRLEFGHDGTLFLASHPTAEPGSPMNEVLVSRSEDAGANWTPPQHLEAPIPVLNDFDDIATEPDVAGAVDVLWTQAELAQGEPIWLSRSTDSGVSWTKHLVRAATPGTISMTSLLPLEDGTLLTFSHDYSITGALGGPSVVSTIGVNRSSDKGESWSSFQELATDAVPQWPTVAQSESGTVHLSYLTVVDGTNHVWMMDSDDSGLTWTEPREVFSYERGGSTVPQPEFAASGEDLALFYFDHRDDVAGDEAMTITPRLSLSSDEGDTWTHHAVGSAFDHATIPYGTIEGDGGLGLFQGLSPFECGFYTSFSQGGASATYGPNDIYAGRFDVRGKPKKHCP